MGNVWPSETLAYTVHGYNNNIIIQTYSGQSALKIGSPAIAAMTSIGV